MLDISTVDWSAFRRRAIASTIVIIRMKLIWLGLLFFSLPSFAADKLSIAAAANLVYAVDALNSEFKKLEPGTDVVVVTGASGSLVAQIKNGAPFDLFLAADVEYPRQLIKLGAADASTFTKFAIGRLVIWTMRPELKLDSIEAVVRDPGVRKIAIANPHTAPYGKAAHEALTRLEVWADAESKIVVGENITQTAQFVETGNADVGFVAMSLMRSPTIKERGYWREVPADLYAPIEQGAVVTNHGAANAAAKRYLAFLGSPEARAVFARFGYRSPQN